MEGQDVDADVVAIVIFLVVLIGMCCFFCCLNHGYHGPKNHLRVAQPLKKSSRGSSSSKKGSFRSKKAVSRSRSLPTIFKGSNSNNSLDGGRLDNANNKSARRNCKKSLRKKPTTGNLQASPAPEGGKKARGSVPTRSSVLQPRGSVQKPKRNSVKRLGSGGSRRGSLGSRNGSRRPSLRPSGVVRQGSRRPSSNKAIPTKPPFRGETE